VRRRPGTAVDATGDVVKEVEVPAWRITLAVALIALVPPLVTVGVGALITQWTQQRTLALERSKLDQTATIETAKLGHETAKLKFDSRKASAELYQRALAIANATERRNAVQFLQNAKLVDENTAVGGMTEAQIPHWPAASGTAP
jgi:hypothetical protein